MTALQWARGTALVGYFGLLLLLVLWNAWIAPPTSVPVAFVLILLVGPLLFPLWGLLHGSSYTHAWTSFLALFYFVLGVGVAYSEPAERGLGFLEILFSVMLYLGAIFFVRLKARQIRRPA